MDLDVLPGPSLPERARTALARAATATVSDPGLPSEPPLPSDHALPSDSGPHSDPGPDGGPGPHGARPVSSQVPVRAARDGSPLLLPRTGSLAAVWLAGGQATVRVSLPAGPPFSALRITGTARPVAAAAAAVSGITACAVTVDSVEFTGATAARVPVAEYRAAQPDPLWRVAPGVLHHLEHGHLTELVHCVRAHGMTGAEWVVPRGLDRYGLELLVFTVDGIAAVRLSFPDGPVSSLNDVPVSLRAALTCRCRAEPGHGSGPGAGSRGGRR